MGQSDNRVNGSMWMDFSCPFRLSSKKKITLYGLRKCFFWDQTCGFSYVVFLGLSKDGVMYLFLLQIFKLLTLIESDFWTWSAHVYTFKIDHDSFIFYSLACGKCIVWISGKNRLFGSNNLIAIIRSFSRLKPLIECHIVLITVIKPDCNHGLALSE